MKDLNPDCPDDVMKVMDGDEIIGCKSYCASGGDGDTSTLAQSCCSGVRVPACPTHSPVCKVADKALCRTTTLQSKLARLPSRLFC